MINTRRVLSAGATLLALVLASGACGAEEAPVQDRDIVGDWLLTEMMSKSYRDYLTQLSEPPVFSFDESGRWEGTDGCNNLDGKFTLGVEGQFETDVQSQTDVGCELPANKAIPAIAVLQSTSEVQVTDDTLELRDNSGTVIGEFTRQTP